MMAIKQKCTHRNGNQEDIKCQSLISLRQHDGGDQRRSGVSGARSKNFVEVNPSRVLSRFDGIGRFHLSVSDFFIRSLGGHGLGCLLMCQSIPCLLVLRFQVPQQFGSLSLLVLLVPGIQFGRAQVDHLGTPIPVPLHQDAFPAVECLGGRLRGITNDTSWIICGIRTGVCGGDGGSGGGIEGGKVA